jgi:hypothetical protein
MVVSTKMAFLFYQTTRHYNPEDSQLQTEIMTMQNSFCTDDRTVNIDLYQVSPTS